MLTSTHIKFLRVDHRVNKANSDLQRNKLSLQDKIFSSVTHSNQCAPGA